MQKRKILFRIVVLLVVFIFVWIIHNLLQTPSNDRIWEEQLAVANTIEINGDLATIHNVRNISYNSYGVVKIERYNQTYNISQLKTMYFLVEPYAKWDGLAHSFFTFEFENNTFISFSVEGRLEKGEDFSPIKGLLNKMELIYVWGDERDLIARRTNWLKHPVYMYPLNVTPQKIQQLFIDLSMSTNDLAQKPRFYNTFTSTCTTELAKQANKVNPGKIPWSFAWIFPGYSDEFLHDLNLINTTLSKEQIRTYFDITARAQHAIDFSAEIRAFNTTAQVSQGDYCSTNAQCILPAQYAVQSNCPFTSICLARTCTVICPLQEICIKDESCDCNSRGAKSQSCMCLNGQCVSVE